MTLHQHQNQRNANQKCDLSSLTQSQHHARIICARVWQTVMKLVDEANSRTRWMHVKFQAN